MNNFGDDNLKLKATYNLDESINNLDKKFKTSFWNEIHDLSRKIYAKECDLEQSIYYLIKIIEKLLQGCLEKKCDLKDLHYPSAEFNNLVFIYRAENLYDYYGGELYELVEYLDHHNNLSDMIKEYKNFIQYFNRKLEHGQKKLTDEFQDNV